MSFCDKEKYMFKKKSTYGILSHHYQEWRGIMMKKFLVLALAVCLACIVFVSAAFAEAVTFKFGASERIRQEIWDNVIDLKTMPSSNSFYDRNFFRFKTSLWGGADFNKDTGIFLKLTSEIYYNLGPYKYPRDKRGHSRSWMRMRWSLIISILKRTIFLDSRLT